MIRQIIPFTFSTMKKTILFLSGWRVPEFAAKSKFVWDEKFWAEYNCIWYKTEAPSSDPMIESELRHLEYLIRVNKGCTVVGRSLGGWWASNLALQPNVVIKKLVLWTPICDASAYPVFKASRKFHPTHRPTDWNYGPHRVLTFNASRDLIVPADAHGYELSNHFQSTNYHLDGGHFYQRNRKAALNYMKDWIET